MFWRHLKGIGMQQILQVYLIRVLHSHVILCPTDYPEGYAHNMSARSLMTSGFRILSSATCNSFLQRVLRHLKEESIELSWWSSGWDSTCQCRGHGLDPWSRKIPHTTGQLSPHATNTEPMHPGAHALQQEKPPQWEAPCTMPRE